LADSTVVFFNENFSFNVTDNSRLMIHLDCQKYLLRLSTELKFVYCRLPRHSFTKYAFLMVSSLTLQVQAQTLPEVVNRALQSYPAIQAAAAQSSSARADIARARSAHLPQIGVAATASAYGSGNLPANASRTAISPTTKLNLWSGGKIEAEVDRAKALTQAAEFQEAGTLDDVAQLAAEAYLNWAKTSDLYSLAVHNYNAHMDTLTDIQTISQADPGRRVDYDQALVRSENAKLALQQRKSEFTQAIQRVQRFWPGDLSPRPFGLDAVVSDTGPLGNVPSSLAQATAMVSGNLPAIAQAQARLQAAQASVRMAKGLQWPTVDLTVSRLPGASGRLDAVTQLQVNAPLYNGGATSAGVEAAVGQLKAAEFALEEARILAREKSALAWQEWAAARARAGTGSQQSLVGDKLVEAYRQQFRIAKRSLLDLLNIQADAFSYRSASQTAFHDERLARVRLLAATGELANRFASLSGLVQAPAK
jgi:adhesin transport system outer membrane protein